MRREFTLGEFYASDPRRAHSSDVGYGSLWRRFAPVPTYRLQWVRATGELYAVELSEPEEAKDPVEVLGGAVEPAAGGGLSGRLVGAVAGSGRCWRSEDVSAAGAR